MSVFIQHRHNKLFVNEDSCSFNKLITVSLLTNIVVLFTLGRRSRYAYSRCWLLPNSCSSALTQLLAKVAEPSAL